MASKLCLHQIRMVAAGRIYYCRLAAGHASPHRHVSYAQIERE
ncbi:hypothetical protein LCGC14_0734870 [marine sediment metagenome]|uniref:Uncharacterized protein n=1 Tax=marine sediment metagenome TaxID=412755 RepID=A0A0F9QTG3_9ZZZZ